eukprot:s371_g14.t1
MVGDCGDFPRSILFASNLIASWVQKAGRFKTSKPHPLRAVRNRFELMEPHPCGVRSFSAALGAFEFLRSLRRAAMVRRGHIMRLPRGTGGTGVDYPDQWREWLLTWAMGLVQ